MHKIFSKFIGLTTALTLTVAACGEDITGVNEGDALTSSEVGAVMAALSASFNEVGGAPSAPALAPVNFNENINITVPCEDGTLALGGSVNGSIDDETFASDVAMEVTWEPNGCVVTDGANTITVDGAPRIKLTLDWTSDAEQSFTFDGKEEGGFSFVSSDGRMGSCAIDVTFSFTSDGTNFTGSISGSICGLEAEAFGAIGIPDAI